MGKASISVWQAKISDVMGNEGKSDTLGSANSHSFGIDFDQYRVRHAVFLAMEWRLFVECPFGSA
jgi:hypothetical protein